MTAAALLRSQLEPRFGPLLTWQDRLAPETFPSGIPEIDRLIHGIPRGCLTEIVGPSSSGRTTLAISLMACATAAEEFCALVDASDSFDPHSAASAGVDLTRLLWVRCGHDAERALKAADLLVQGGGFGVVLMDLGSVPRLTARRISLASWFRLRRAVEHTPIALVTVARESNARTCASLVLEMRPAGPRWSGVPGCSQLLRGLAFDASRVKPAAAAHAAFHAAV